jgi:uncharacterized protein
MLRYFDTSALVKRYDPREVGAITVLTIFSDPKSLPIFTSSITSLELASAFRTKQRQAIMTQANMNAGIAVFDAHCSNDYVLVQPKSNTYLEARRLILTHKLRAYDALHIATAISIVQIANLALTDLNFVTSDQDQATAAIAEGLSVNFV